MLSTRSHPDVISDYIAAELALERITEVGQGEAAKELGVHTSPFGVVPKRQNPGKSRLILDQSSSEGFSVNWGCGAF